MSAGESVPEFYGTWSSLTHGLKKGSGELISRFAFKRSVFYLYGEHFSYVVDMDGEFALIRRRDSHGNWSEPFWVEAYQDVIRGSPPVDVRDAMRREVEALTHGTVPPRPDRNPRQNDQQDLFW